MMRTVTAVVSPVWANAEHTAINATVTFSDLGTVPFTARSTDVEESGRTLFDSIRNGNYGPIGAYVAPAAPVPASITRRQLLIQLQRAGWITEAEAVAAAATGAAPALLSTVIDGLPTDEAKTEARITWAAMSQAERGDPLLAAAAAAAGASESALDDFFRAAAVI